MYAIESKQNLGLQRLTGTFDLQSSPAEGTARRGVPSRALPDPAGGHGSGVEKAWDTRRRRISGSEEGVYRGANLIQTKTTPPYIPRLRYHLRDSFLLIIGY